MAGSGKPTKTIEGQAKLALVGKIKEALENEETRKEIRLEARRLLAEQQEKKFDIINEYVQPVVEEGRSEVTEKWVTDVVKKVGTVSDVDVRNCLKKEGIRVAAVQRGRRHETLDGTKKKEIRRWLNVVGKTDLYDFLGEKSNCRSKTLRERAQDVYDEAGKTGKADQFTAGRKKLAGICREMFKDDELRKRYDNTLAFEACGKLDAILLASGLDNVLTQLEVEKAMNKAVELGIDRSVAWQYIRKYAEDNKYAIQTATESEKKKQRDRLTQLEVEESAPSDLRVAIVGRTARLRWRETRRHRSLAYIVVRRESTAPGHSKDGKVVGRDVNADRYDDVGVPPGKWWHYGVFAVQDGFTSKRCTTSGPHIRAAEPADVVAKGADRQVVVQWKPPRGCLGVEVWRKVGTPPARRGQGTRVTASGKSATDHGLTNGRGYGYLVLASYQDQDRGGKVWSSGVAVEATPVSPPEPVDDLRVKTAGRDVILRWTPPRNGRVEIRRSKRIPGVSRGRTITADEADRLLGDLVTAAPQRRSED